MNRLVSYEQNAEEMKMVESVACPKPRRLTALNPSLNTNQSQSDVGASELLDLILNKGERSMMQLQLGSSPPFFCGSPPSRVSNPVIQDERFGMSFKAASPFSPTAGRNGGCVWMKSRDKAVAVRIEREERKVLIFFWAVL